MEKIKIVGSIKKETEKAYQISLEIEAMTGGSSSLTRDLSMPTWFPKSRSEKIEDGIITEPWLLDSKLDEIEKYLTDTSRCHARVQVVGVRNVQAAA